MKMVGGNSKL